MRKQPTDRQVITRALAMLEEGLLASLLPGRLMIEYQLTRDRAGRLASEALKRRREQEKPG